MKDENSNTSPSLPLIMLVDDNEIILTTLSDYLLSEGFEVIACQSGKDAINKAKINNPALIVMDIQMPEIDGIETTQRLKADKKLANIPIIALTALAMKSDRERCLAVGMNDYISKPVSLQNLVSIIKKHLNI
jgi:CheY-like chemotaxis protein